MKTNRSYRGLLAPLLILAVAWTGVSHAQQVQSDYETVENFKKEYQAIDKAIDKTAGLNDMESLIERIKTLENDYSEHEELIDKALYPESYDDRMESLKKRTVAAQQRLATIEQQEGRLRELSDEVASYDRQLQQLSARTDSLRNRMQQSVKSERQLSNIVQRYRKNLEQRDALILTIVDSLIIRYKNMDVESFAEKASARESMAGANPIALIQSIASENVNLLISNPELTTEELIRMNAVQHQFQQMWTRVGDRLLEVYEDNGQETRQQVEETIARWEEELSARTWPALNKAFAEAGVNLPQFDGRDSFFSSLNAYLDEVLKATDRGVSEADYRRFRQFSDFWTNRLKLNWADHMSDGNILSNRQITAVDQKIGEWMSRAEPGSNWLVYLLGFSVLAIVALGALLAREKAGK